MTAISTIDRVSYRNILMTGVVTERFNQRLVFAQGESDPQYTTFHIQVSALLHLDREHFAAIDIFGTEPPPTGSQASTVYPTPADKCRAIQSYLMQPRGRFVYYSGSVIMLDVGNKASYGTDTEDSLGTFPAGVIPEMDNGPKPRDVEVTETAAGNIYRVRFGIEFAIQLCEGEVEPPLPQDSQITGNPPQSADYAVVHSWSYVESKDDKFWSTKTLSGSIRVRNIYDWAHSLRWLVVPPLQESYQRSFQRFAQSTDKKTLEYVVNDVQRYASPPEPATGWSCRYSQSFTGPVAVAKIETVSIRLEGAPGTNKKHLTKTALEVVRSIMPASMDPAKRPKFQREEDLDADKRFPKSFLHHAQIIDYVSEASIELIVSFRTIFQSDKGTPSNSDDVTVHNLLLDNVGVFPAIKRNTTEDPPTPEYHDRAYWPQPNLFDSIEPTGIFATYLQTACGSRHGITQPYQLTFVDEQGQITSGPPTTVYGERKPVGRPAEVWETTKPIEPEDYDNRAATALYQDSAGDFLGEMRFPLTEVELESEYQEDHGTMALPKANSGITTGPTVEVFSFRSPVLFRISRAVATRVGGWPRMPKPEKVLTTDGATETLVDYKVIFEEPRTEQEERTPVYRAHALLIYSVDRPIDQMSRLRTGISPAIDWGQFKDNAGVVIEHGSMVATSKLTNDMFGGNIP